MLVLPPRAIHQLAERVEQAYLRRRPQLHREDTYSRVWSAAAEVLVALNRSDPSLPIDPELYVTSQLRERTSKRPDPWGELVHPEASIRYRRQVRRIILALRKELRSELRWIDRLRRQGIPLDRILSAPTSRTSPLSRFIAAVQYLGPDAAVDLHEAVRRQHDACPLYRQACANLLPDHTYPVHDVLVDFVCGGPSIREFSLN